MPQGSPARTIGEIGKSAFIGGKPVTWQVESEPSQGNDFGFDLTMQIFGRHHALRGRFSVQIKASTKTRVHKDADGDYISVPIKRETCNLFLQEGTAVMLAYVDLPNGMTDEDASILYMWMEEAMQERLKGRKFFDETDPKKIVFRVSVSQVVDKTTDIVPYLENFWGLTRLMKHVAAQAGKETMGKLSALSPEARAALSKIDSSAFEKLLVGPDSSRVPPENIELAEPEPGTSAAAIKQLASFVTSGSLIEAKQAADALIGRVDDLPRDVASSFFYQLGRVRTLAGRHGEAADAFAKASELNPTSANYFAVKLEAAISAHWNGDHESADADFLRQLTGEAAPFITDPQVIFQLARIYALQENYEEAERLIASLPGVEQLKAQTLYSVTRGRWDEAIEQAEMGIASATESKDRFFLLALKMRALLRLVLGNADSINMGGPPSLDVRNALRLKEATFDSLARFRAAGWPSNSSLLMDCANTVAVIFGASGELCALVDDFAKQRPDLEAAQDAALRVGALSNNPKIAIAALERMGSTDPEDIGKQAMLYNEAGMLAEGVALTVQNLLSIPHAPFTDLVVGMNAVAAYRIGLSKEEAKLAAYLEEPEADATAKLLMWYVMGDLKNPDSRAPNLELLWSEYKKGTHSEYLRDNLFKWLRPDVETDIDRLIEIGEATSLERGLVDMEAAKYAASLLQRERFLDVVRITQPLLQVYPTDENLGMARAVALDKLGFSTEAEQVLQAFGESTRLDLLNARAQLLVRTGEIDPAIALVQRGLANVDGRADKFQLQRMLANLYSSVDPQRYLDAVWRLGQLAARDDEDEEGVFLANYAMASASMADVPEEQIAEFYSRVEAYRLAFPHSIMFRVGFTREDAEPGELVAGLRELAGITPQREAAQARMREQGETHGSGIPFSYRPRTFAPFASNIVDLLSFTTSGPPDHEWSRVIVGNVGQVAPPSFELPPIIDLPTAFVLVELDLFDEMFQRWKSVAIPKVSLAELADFQIEPIGPGNAELVDRMSEAVRRNKGAIIQPSAPADAEGYPRGESATVGSIVAQSGFQYFTFDCASAHWHDTENSSAQPALTLWDVIGELERTGIITAKKSQEIRLKVSSWNTRGTPLTADDIAESCWLMDVQSLKDGEDSAGGRAVEAYLSHDPDTTEFTVRVCEALKALAQKPLPIHTPKVQWFLRQAFNKLAQLTGTEENADKFAVSIAARLAMPQRGGSPPAESMQFIWYSLNVTRADSGGTPQRQELLKELGITAARVLSPLLMRFGAQAVAEEDSYLNRLFTIASLSKAERVITHAAYTARTRLMQNTVNTKKNT